MRHFASTSRRYGLVAVLAASGAPASAQNYRLSAELPCDWREAASDFAVSGEQVVFAARGILRSAWCCGASPPTGARTRGRFSFTAVAVL